MILERNYNKRRLSACYHCNFLFKIQRQNNINKYRFDIRICWNESADKGIPFPNKGSEK